VNGVQTHSEALVRKLFELHNDGPDVIMAAFEEILDPEIVWSPSVIGGLEGGNYQGYAGMRRYYADRAETFAEGQVHVLGVEQVGDDGLVTHVLSTGVGRASGAQLEEELWMAMTMRDGRVLRWQAFTSRAEAMECLGA
jgi:ketosteroid isomerase-like protein